MQSLELSLLFFILCQHCLNIYIYICAIFDDALFRKKFSPFLGLVMNRLLQVNEEVMLILLYKLRMANKQKSRESIFLSFLLCLVSYYIMHSIKARIGQGYL